MSSSTSYGEHQIRTTEQHVHIFTLRGLKKIFEMHGFRVEQTCGIGSLPLMPFWLSRVIEKIDPVHSYFIAIKAVKLENEQG